MRRGTEGSHFWDGTLSGRIFLRMMRRLFLKFVCHTSLVIRILVHVSGALPVVNLHPYIFLFRPSGLPELRLIPCHARGAGQDKRC